MRYGIRPVHCSTTAIAKHAKTVATAGSFPHSVRISFQSAQLR
jgi:hypothetical protein